MTAEELWEAFCDHNLDLDPTTLHYTVWQFLNGEKGCNRLASLVQAKIKTANSSIYETFALDEEKIPEVGDYAIILDSDEEPLFIIKDTAVYTKKFSEIDEDFAAKEGEGDQSLERWQKIHRERFEKQCEEYGLEFSEDLLLLCEEFELAFIA